MRRPDQLAKCGRQFVSQRRTPGAEHTNESSSNQTGQSRAAATKPANIAYSKAVTARWSFLKLINFVVMWRMLITLFYGAQIEDNALNGITQDLGYVVNDILLVQYCGTLDVVHAMMPRRAAGCSNKALRGRNPVRWTSWQQTGCRFSRVPKLAWPQASCPR